MTESDRVLFIKVKQAYRRLLKITANMRKGRKSLDKRKRSERKTVNAVSAVKVILREECATGPVLPGPLLPQTPPVTSKSFLSYCNDFYLTPIYENVRKLL